MTLKDAISRLQSMAAKHGEGIAVYFDCPHCNKSFEPNTLKALAVHLTERARTDPTKDRP